MYANRIFVKDYNLWIHGQKYLFKSESITFLIAENWRESTAVLQYVYEMMSLGSHSHLPQWYQLPSGTKFCFCTKSLKKAILLLFFARSHFELLGMNPPVNSLWLQRMSFLVPFNCWWKLPAWAQRRTKGWLYTFSERCRWLQSQWNSLANMESDSSKLTRKYHW